MKNIDLQNVLYHCIYSDDGTSFSPCLKTLESILETGYLYSTEEQMKRNINNHHQNYAKSNDPNYICLGIHPNSKRANEFKKPLALYLKGLEKENGYVFSQCSFGFGLKQELIDDLKASVGNFEYELYVKDKISIRDYAVCVYNAGGSIDCYLSLYIEYLKYKAKVINYKEYKDRIYPQFKHCDYKKIDVSIKEYENLFEEIGFANTLKKWYEEDIDSLIFAPNKFEQIKNLLDKYDYNIPIVDCYGEEIISIDYQREKVKELIKKI